MHIKPWLVGTLLVLMGGNVLRAADGAIDSATPNPVAYNGTIYLTGWATGGAWGPSDVRLFVDGNYQWSGYWAQLDSPNYNWTHWSVSIPASDLSPGDHVISTYVDAYWQDDTTGTQWDGGVVGNTVTVHVNSVAVPAVQGRATAASINFGQSITFYSDGTDSGGILTGLTGWVRGPNASAYSTSDAWSGWTQIINASFGACASNTASAAFTPTGLGYWQYHTNASNANGTNAGTDITNWVSWNSYSTGPVVAAIFTVGPATPSASNWGSRTFATTCTVASTDLGAGFVNPYTSGVTQPTGTITYSIISGGSGAVTAGRMLLPGTYTVRASYSGDGNYNATAADVIWTVNNQAPVTTISANPTPIILGQTTTITATTTDADGNLVSQAIDYLAPGSSTWIGGSAAAGTAWSGSPTNSHPLTWTVPASILNSLGVWQFRASGSDGSLTSAYATTSITVNPPPQAATPSFSPVAGTYTSIQTVTITSATTGATIRYTTDGSTPSETVGTVYSSAVSISSSLTLKAIAYKASMTDSNVASGAYTINLPQAATPSFSPVAGTYTSMQTVTITSATTGATIRYTMDGSTPSETVGTVYSSAVSVSSSLTLKAIAYKTGYIDSAVGNAAYVINLPPAAAPTFSPAAGTYAATQAVTIASATTGATIRYTTDGSTPSETVGTVYSSAVSVSSSLTLKAIAYKAGFSDSTVTSGVYTMTVAAPTFSPVAGMYSNAQTVTITSATTGASIRYTTDGSTPSETAGTVYSGTPVAINATATLKAIAYKAAYADSPVTSGAYTMTVTAPVFSPVAGTYNNAQTVTITTATTGATIRYTTDGSTPSATAGTVYSGTPVSISATATLKAIAYKTGFTTSGVTSGTYTMTVTAPVFSPVAGTYNNAQTVTITSATTGASIRYTTTGTAPTSTTGTVYSGAISISATTPLQAIAYKTGFTTSTVTSGTYTMIVTAPTFSPVAGTYNNTQTVTITSATTGASIRYTTTGTAPTSTTGTVYSGAISISATTPLQAIAYKTGSTASTVTSGTYTMLVTAPTFSPAAGTYDTAQSVTITSATTGASIRYTTSGTAPTSTTGTVYSGAISISAATPLKAIAYKTGSTTSAVTSGTYAFGHLPVTAVSASVSSITLGQTVTITATTTDADANLLSQVIDYSTNGGSSWVSGSSITGANWSGGPTGSHTLAWIVPASIIKAAGTWQFRASGNDGIATSNLPTVSVTVGKVTPVAPNWANRTFSSNQYTVAAADLSAAFAHPSSGSVTQPTGTVTYSITAGGSGAVAVGTVLLPGTYTIRASYPGDANYNAATASVTWTISSFVNPTGDSDGDGIPDSQEASGHANVYDTATNDVGMTVPAGWPRLAAADTTSSHKDNAVGITTGQLSVDKSGAATYAIPLYACPGTAGMEPKLSLNYSSQGGAGILGYGWSLSGVSAITRGSQTRAIDGQIHGVDFSANDRYYLDGQRLIAISGADGGNGTEYRTEMNSFSRIVSYGSSGNGGPGYFKVWTKAGQIMEFGNTSDSTLTPANVNAALTWSIDKISDTKSNYMAFTYSTNATTGEQTLSRIDYTGNTAASVSPYNSIQFAYESRSDSTTGYVFGALISRTQRLKHIKAYAGTTLVHDYAMDYTAQPNTNTQRSLLTGLQEFGADNKAYPELKFQYSDPAPGFSRDDSWKPPAALAIYNLAQPGAGFFDLNNDGRLDFVRSHVDVSGNWQTNAWLNTPNGWVQADGTNSQPDYRLPFALANDYTGLDSTTHFVDLNGDGFPDIISVFSSIIDPIDPRVDNTSTIYRNTGSGWTSDGSWSLPLPPSSAFAGASYPGGTSIVTTYFYRDPAEFVDLNGDGLPDCVCWSSFTVTYDEGIIWSSIPVADAWINLGPNNIDPATGTHWQYAPQYQTPYGNARFVDVNGDGLPDLVQSHSFSSGGVSNGVALNTGNGFRVLSGDELSRYLPPGVLDTTAPGQPNAPIGTELVDLNSDGLPDFILRNDPNNVNLTYYNTGNGWVPAPQGFLAPVELEDNHTMVGTAFLDIDNDGLVDLVHFWGGDFRTYLNTGSSWTSQPVSSAYNAPWQITDANIPSTGADFVDLNGDGAVDEVWNWQASNGSQTSTLQSSAGAAFNNRINPDHLIKVTTGMGVSASIKYKPLTDPTVYTKGTGAVYPQADIVGPMYVVSEVDNDDGVGGQYAMTYAYAGLRSDALHGSAGFASMTVTDSRTGINTATSFRQDYPFIGMASYAATKQANAVVLTATNTSWTEQASGNVHFPYANLTVQQSYELNGAYVSGTSTTATYDSYGNALTVDVESIDASGNPTPGYDKATANTYTNDTANWFLGRLIQSQVVASAPGTPTLTRTSAFAYDPGFGLLTQEIVEPNDTSTVDPQKLTTAYVYDAFGNKTSATVSGMGLVSRTTSTAYDPRGQFPISATNALGHTETYSYDSRWGVLTSQTGPNGLTSTWNYDGMGRKIKETRPDGTITEANYRWAGAAAPAGSAYLVETEISGGQPSLAFYDSMGRAIYAFGLNGGDFDGNPKIVGTQTQYDSFGRAFWTSLLFYYGNTPAVGSQVLASDYDVLNRPRAQMNADEEASGGSIYTSFEYDGLVTKVTNPKGQITVTTKNNQGQILSIVVNATSGAADRGETDYTYDAYGRILTTAVVNPGGSSVTTTSGYDLTGRKIFTHDLDMGIWTYAYDAVGELTSQTDAKGQTTTMAYDQLGRLVSRAEVEGVTAWTYDTVVRGSGTYWLGKLASVAAPNSYSESYIYDSLGRPSITTHAINTGTGTETFALGQQYDTVGRPTIATYPGGYQVTNVYNAYGFLSQVRQASVSTGLVNDTVQNQLFWQADSYSLWGGVNGSTYGNGVTNDTIVADTTGRVKGFGIGLGSGGTAVASYGYYHDVLGNLITRNDAATGRSESYAYDGLSRLTQSALTVGTGGLGTNKTVNIGYDSLGNIANKDDVGAYTYGQNAGPHAVTAAGGNSYAYDADGNMTSGAGRTVTWTSFNQAKHIAQGSHSSDFTFDANHQRATQTTDHGTTVYVGAAFERVTTSSGTDLKFYIFTPAGRSAVRTVHVSVGTVETRYFHQDALGSIVAVTNETGAVAERYAYDPWGNQTSLISHSSTATTRGFTDHEMLDDLGLIHMNGRIYDPLLGRFMSADPFVQSPGDSQSYNRYSYCMNNPVNGTDPSGYFKLSLKMIVVIVAVVVISVVTYGAASAAAMGAMSTAATATTAATYSIGGMAISASTAGVIAGAVGGAAAGFASGFAGSLLNGGSVGDAFRSGVLGAASGIIMGGISGYYGNTWTLGRVATTTVGGGFATEVNGGSFEKGALISAAISLVTYGAIKMQEFTITQSKLDLSEKNASGDSVGFNGSNFKTGGGRFDERSDATQVESSLGGVQGGQGIIRLPLFGRIEYARGSFLDRTVEAYGGVHDWLNSWTGYNPATGNYNPPLSYIGRHLESIGINSGAVASTMNWVDVPLATPIVAASVVGVYAPTYGSIYNQSRNKN